MHHFYTKLSITFALITLHSFNTQAQYNDDTTPRKIRLEDLEVDIEEKEQRALYSQYAHNHHPSYETLKVHPTASSFIYQQNVPIPALPRPITTANSYLPAPVKHFNFGVHPFAYNSINDETSGEADTDVNLSPTTQQSQQQQQQPPSLYINPNIRQASASFALVPTLDDSGISNARNYATATAIPLHPTQATPVPYQQQQQQHQQLLISPAGVRYLTSNELSDATPTAPTYVLIRKPALEYGVPDAPIRQLYTLQQQQQLAAQSNQYAYAPKRAESNSLAASHHGTIPYPPSFISITTSNPVRASASYAADVPAPSYLTRTTFRPSQPDPVPDFFTNRQTKSLLDSYIPSWVVAKMVQQRRNLFNRNTLATPYNHRNYKRALASSKDIKLKKRSVKKALPPLAMAEKKDKNNELQTKA